MGGSTSVGKQILKIAVASKEKKKKTLFLMYVNPRITIDSTRPGRLRNGYQNGLTLLLTLQ